MSYRSKQDDDSRGSSDLAKAFRVSHLQAQLVESSESQVWAALRAVLQQMNLSTYLGPCVCSPANVRYHEMKMAPLCLRICY